MANADVVLPETTSLLNVNMANVTKLTGPKFLMWSHQVQALLHDQGVAGYLDGSTAAPPPTVITATGVVSVNAVYTKWKRQDQLIYSILLGAMTDLVQPILSQTSSSAEIWNHLSSTYAKPSCGHVPQIRQQLKNWKKATKSIDEYFQGLTTRFDQLASLGKGLDLEDKIEIILEGLPEEYKTICD